MKNKVTGHRLVLVMVLAVLLVLGMAQAAYAEWFFPEVQLTTKPVHQRAADISGTKIVYEDYRNYVEPGDDDDPEDDWDIYVLDIETKVSKCLTPYHTAHGSPSISGDRVVWFDRGHGSSPMGVYYHNLDNGKTKRLPLPNYSRPQISGERVVYVSAGDVYVYNIITGKKKRVTPDAAQAGEPDISGKKIVYSDGRNGNSDIYMYDLAAGVEEPVTTESHPQHDPAISGDKVVWTDHRNEDANDGWDIYLRDLTTNSTKRVTTNEWDQTNPAISGNFIVWVDWRSTLGGIYLYDIRGQYERMVLSNDSNFDREPSIAGSRIVYHDDRADDYNTDIFLAQLAYPRISITTAAAIDYNTQAQVGGTLTNAHGTPLLGRSVTLQYSSDKQTWTNGASTTTNASGNYTVLSPTLTEARYLRVVTVADASYPSAASSTKLVKPRVSFTGAPVFSDYVHTFGSTRTVWGYFLPRHASDLHQVTVRAYRRELQSGGGYEFVYRKSYSTTTSNPDGYSSTKYRGTVKLPYKGYWRLRAYHPEDSKNAKSYSTYRYVTVE